MLPQNPSNVAAQPELTFFTIVKADNNGGLQGSVWTMRNGAGNSLIFLAVGAAGKLRFFTRSINGQVADANDTVVIAADGSYYLVCVQYSFTTKTSRIIINGRDNSATNVLQDDFRFDVPGDAAVFELNLRQAIEQFLGSTGEMLWYDVALLSNANINKLANSYYLKKYPSLVWVDI